MRLVLACQGIREELYFNVKSAHGVKWPGFHHCCTSAELLNLGLCHIFKIKF